MKVGHLASFNGNSGDNAHHNAFRRVFEEVIQCSVDWVSIEIREFYRSWNLRRFDERFVREVNQYDFLVVGGGNFFEVCHDYSDTGCTINLKTEILNTIKVPIFFNALGFDIHRGVSDQNLDKFKTFIDDLSARNNCFITFRNDGSIENFKSVYGELNSEIKEIPDGGFSYSPPAHNDWLPKEHRPVIAINIANDRLEYRLQKKNFDELCSDLAEVYTSIVYQTGALLRFFPHIVGDYEAIQHLLPRFSDQVAKYHIQVMPHLCGQGTEDAFFSGYHSSDVVTGMRFHTNVCGISMNKPTCPIVSFLKLEHTYKHLGLDNQLVWADSEGFIGSYKNKLMTMLECGASTQQQKVREVLQQRYRNRLEEVVEWLGIS